MQLSPILQQMQDKLMEAYYAGAFADSSDAKQLIGIALAGAVQIEQGNISLSDWLKELESCE